MAMACGVCEVPPLLPVLAPPVTVFIGPPSEVGEVTAAVFDELVSEWSSLQAWA